MIGHFEDKKIGNRKYRYYIDDENIKEIVGIKFNDKIYDIKEENVYEIIKRNSCGFLDNKQEILLNNDYALYIDEYYDCSLKEYLLAIKMNLLLNLKEKNKKLSKRR